MPFRKLLTLISIISISATANAQEQVVIDWNGQGDNNQWSTAANWSDNEVPNSNAKTVRFNLAVSADIDVDGNYTINRYVYGASGQGQTHSLKGTGTLTLDANNNTIANSSVINNSAGGQGGTLRFAGSRIVIKNSAQSVSTIRNQNSSGNSITFDKDSVLTLNTILRTIPGSGGTLNFNGTFGRSSANLQIGSANVIFGDGHDSTSFGNEIVLLGNAKLTINGGSVLNSGRRFQVNGSAGIVLNGANAINGANFLVGSDHNFTLDVNANQANMGIIVNIGGNFTINLNESVTQLAFQSSAHSSGNWRGGKVTIVGFRENTIRFGTNANGLSRAQLALINNGEFTLDRNGYLTKAR